MHNRSRGRPPNDQFVAVAAVLQVPGQPDKPQDVLVTPELAERLGLVNLTEEKKAA